jgi:hypothetical protein
VLPAGWDQLDDLGDWNKAESLKAMNEALWNNAVLYWPTNLVLLVIGVVGWGLLVIGLVIGFLWGSKDSDE